MTQAPDTTDSTDSAEAGSNGHGANVGDVTGSVPTANESGDGGATRLVVIGAGPGGYPAAFLAAELGMSVTLIDEEAKPGGVCLHRGCIPSKALLHVASVLHEARDAAEWGLHFDQPQLDLDRLRGWKTGVVDKLTGGLGQLARQRRVTYVQGRATLTGPHSLVVRSPGNGPDGVEHALEFDYAILATGSRPATVPGLDIDSPRLMDSTSALEVETVPPTLLVVGGGYIGLELGSVYAALGSRVTVVEMTDGLLPGADRDLVRHLARRLERDFEEILLETRVTEMRDEGDAIRVKLTAVSAEGATGPEERSFDRALVAVGRRPNSENLGLDHTAVQLGPRGFIEVDIQRRTAEPSIFAIGDVAGEPMLAHKATHEARVAVEAIAGRPSAWDPRAIPAVVFTDPEIAWAGLTEEEALNQRIEVEVSTVPWVASGRASTLGRTDGLTKLVLEPHTHRVLGVGIVGPGAGELISEAALAIEMGAVADDLRFTIHPHPTLTETLMESAEVLYGTSPHYIGRTRDRARH